MMILPLADALQNCLQNLTSRIAGIDNEQMTGRVMGMGAMLGFGVGAIKEQFKSPSSNTKGGNSNSDGSSNGFKGFVSRAKSVINPGMSLSSEKDYNGNVNPIRNVIPKQSNSAMNNATENSTKLGNVNNNIISNNKFSKAKNIASSVGKAGFNATKTYLNIGAKMAEGDFSNLSYKKTNQNIRKNNFQNTEFTNTVLNDNKPLEKLGDENEFNTNS